MFGERAIQFSFSQWDPTYVPVMAEVGPLTLDVIRASKERKQLELWGKWKFTWRDKFICTFTYDLLYLVFYSIEMISEGSIILYTKLMDFYMFTIRVRMYKSHSYLF